MSGSTVDTAKPLQHIASIDLLHAALFVQAAINDHQSVKGRTVAHAPCSRDL